MRRERVSDDIYVFTSGLYAQVTASAVVHREGIVVMDTLPFPEETREMIDYLNSLGKGKIKYLINSHWHADHTFGNYLFDDDVQMVCHRRCYDNLLNYGQRAIDEAKANTPEFEEVELRIPDIIFEDGGLVLHIGNKSVELHLMPGHTNDQTVAFAREDKVMLASDAMMPVPYFIAGDRYQMRASLLSMLNFTLESMVQGHGEVLLRGEIPKAINASVAYLDTIEEKVRHVVQQGESPDSLKQFLIDDCGLSRIPLNGLVQELHQINLRQLYDEFSAEKAFDNA